ncbi:MAG TPA: hypothetical protein VIP98_23560, partial [Microlunatus sp.]
MITTPAILIIFGGLSGLLGHLMAPRVAGFSPQPTVWLDRRLITATTSVAGAAAMCLASNWPELISFTLLGIGCGLLILIDVATFRLPDVIVGPLYLIMIGG